MSAAVEGKNRPVATNFQFLKFLSIRDFTSAMRLHFRSDLVGACLPQTLLRTDEEELCQFDAIPPTYREKQSVPDGERPIVHIAIVCGLWQGASYFRDAPCFYFEPSPTFEIPPLLPESESSAASERYHLL